MITERVDNLIDNDFQLEYNKNEEWIIEEIIIIRII
jgi:hypothetical protein